MKPRVLDDYMDITRRLAIAVRRKEVPAEAAAAVIASTIVASGIRPADVGREINLLLSAWRAGRAQA